MLQQHLQTHLKHEKVQSLSKAIEDMKKNQIEILELKCKITKIKTQQMSSIAE